MNRRAMYVNSRSALQTMMEKWGSEWELDPDLKIVRLDSIAIYHFVKYTDEERAEREQLEQVVEKYADVESIRSVNINDADALLAEGYTIQDTYAKTVTLIKRCEKAETNEGA